jgi:hypothetical protein
LIGSLAIGFVFGYFISRAFYKNNYDEKLKHIGYLMRKKNSENIILKDQINQLKSEYRNSKLKENSLIDIEVANIQPHPEEP